MMNTHRTYLAELFGVRPLRGSYPEAPLATSPAVEVLGAAVLLGGAGRVLLDAPLWGLNLSVWIACLLAAARLLEVRWGLAASRSRRLLLTGALMFALAVAWRASPVLALLNAGAALLLLALAAGDPAERLARSTLSSLLRAGVAAAMNAAGGCLVLLTKEIPLLRTASPAGRRGAAAARGMLIALPPLCVFAALFASADQTFQRGISALFRWDAGDLLPALLLIAFWGWISAGYLRQLLFGVTDGGEPRVRLRSPPWFGRTEAATVLGLLNLLFASFVAIQIGYLFGGAERVQTTAGLSYADYARSGFFELVTVAGLVLPLLLGLHALLGAEDRRAQRVFRSLAGGLLLLLIVIMLSAVQRMRLYQAEYGLTELRFYTSTFMAWLAVVFVWFAATVLRGRRERFAWGAVVAGLATLAALNVLNPSALVARVNLARLENGARFDAAYLASLGPDAIPPVVAAWPALSATQQCELSRWLRREGRVASENDWRSGNWGRFQARARLNNSGVLPAPAPVRSAARCRSAVR